VPGTNKPLITESQCPQSALQKFRRVFIILDCTEPSQTLLRWDFDIFTALAGLKHVCVAVLLRKDTDIEMRQPYIHSHVVSNLHGIRERLPAQAHVQFGVEPGSREEAMALERWESHQKNFGRPLSCLSSCDPESIYTDRMELVTSSIGIRPAVAVLGSLSAVSPMCS
jgi:hypothetical protein